MNSKEKIIEARFREYEMWRQAERVNKAAKLAEAAGQLVLPIVTESTNELLVDPI